MNCQNIKISACRLGIHKSYIKKPEYNNVLSKFTFSASATGFDFSVSGNKLTITTDNAPTGDVTITASRSVARCGVLVWTDKKYGPDIKTDFIYQIIQADSG